MAGSVNEFAGFRRPGPPGATSRCFSTTDVNEKHRTYRLSGNSFGKPPMATQPGKVRGGLGSDRAGLVYGPGQDFSHAVPEAALLRLEAGLLRLVFPEYLPTTGSIPLSRKAGAAPTALSHARIPWFAGLRGAGSDEAVRPAPTPIPPI